MLLPDNYWSLQMVPMAMAHDCTRHALLSFTTSYALDYEPNDQMRLRANYHYRRAVELLSEALSNAETYEVGRDDAVVAAMIMILSNDVSHYQQAAERVESAGG
jgi:hypothetical protein